MSISGPLAKAMTSNELVFWQDLANSDFLRQIEVVRSLPTSVSSELDSAKGMSPQAKAGGNMHPEGKVYYIHPELLGLLPVDDFSKWHPSIVHFSRERLISAIRSMAAHSLRVRRYESILISTLIEKSVW